MKQLYIKCIISIVLLLLVSIDSFSRQKDSTAILRKNYIKINLISLPPLINNLNQKWIGLEYQRVLNKDFSISITTDIGIFEDYSYTKYHDFFDEGDGFAYTKKDIWIPGYHIIPALRYIWLKQGKKTNLNLYATLSLDFYQYFLKKEIYHSQTNHTESYINSTYRLNMGAGIGVQYIAFNRISLDLNISIFTKIFSESTSEELPELYPENSFWKSENNSSWATINLMLGYAFGRHKTKKFKGN